MNLITLDLETYYDKAYSLSKLTTEEYVRSEQFEVIGIGIKENDGETRWFSGSTTEIRAHLRSYKWSDSFVLAHNTMFDGAILSWLFGITPKGWLDTLCMARAIHGVDAGGSLKALAQRYEIGEKGTEVLNALGKHRADFTQEELERYGEYCCNDVELTYKLFHILMESFNKRELKVIDTTLRMFIDPTLELDTALLEQHLVEVKAKKERLLEAAKADKKLLMSNDQFADLLKHLGVEPPRKISVRTKKETWAFAKTDEAFKELANHPDHRVQALVAARLGTKTTLEETRTQRFIDISKRGKLPVPIKYYAAHTGRWGGDDKINLQNLPSRGQNAGKLKAAIKAPDEHVIIDCDSSQIEARTVAWMSGQADLVEFFQKNNEEIAAGVPKKEMQYDPYKIMAAQIYGVGVDQVDDGRRFVGKTTILGCFGADTLVLTDHGWKRIVEVQGTDMLWDGEEWVTHQGVMPQGVKQTIRGLGVDATPDHEILTEHGWREWNEVITNPSLTQSALRRGSLPSLTGDNISKQQEGLLDGTRLYDARVGGKGKLTGTTSNRGVLPGAIAALKRRLIKLASTTGDTKVSSLMKRIVHGYLIVSQAVYQGVIELLVKRTPIMGGGVFLSTNLGAQIEQHSCDTLYHWTDGKIIPTTSTESTIVKGMNPEIYDLLPDRKTRRTSEPSKPCRQKLMTYDIAYAGPRNRYTIATNAGALIVHNCGYGMGAVKFQAQLKTFNVDVSTEECKRIIDVYRSTYDQIPKLWRQAQTCLEAIITQNAANFGATDAVKFDARERGFLLPSGLWQRYEGLHKTTDDQGKDQYDYTTRKGLTKIYGGKVVENICQAVARCVIAEQMLKIGNKYPVVLTVHDAIACIAPVEEAEEARAYVEECMRWRPAWAPTLPLNCESGMGVSYGEC